MPEPFAVLSDYTARGYRLGSLTEAVVVERLGSASRILRARSSSIDQRIDDGTLDPTLVIDVVCAMVARSVPVDGTEGVGAVQQSAGPFAQSLTFSNPSGSLAPWPSELKSLGIGGQRAFSISLTGEDS